MQLLNTLPALHLENQSNKQKEAIYNHLNLEPNTLISYNRKIFPEFSIH